MDRSYLTVSNYWSQSTRSANDWKI